MRSLKFPAAAFCVLAALSAVSIEARAAETAADTRADESLRCFAVTSMLVSADDAEVKQFGQLGSLFFMGRLDGALSDQALEDRLFKFSQNIANEDMEKIVTRCGEIMKARGEAVQAIGGRVEAREKAAADAKK